MHAYVYWKQKLLSYSYMFTYFIHHIRPELSISEQVTYHLIHYLYIKIIMKGKDVYI